MGIDEDYANDIIIKKQFHDQTPKGLTTIMKLLLEIVYHKIRRIQ